MMQYGKIKLSKTMYDLLMATIKSDLYALEALGRSGYSLVVGFKTMEMHMQMQMPGTADFNVEPTGPYKNAL